MVKTCKTKTWNTCWIFSIVTMFFERLSKFQFFRLTWSSDFQPKTFWKVSRRNDSLLCRKTNFSSEKKTLVIKNTTFVEKELLLNTKIERSTWKSEKEDNIANITRYLWASHLRCRTISVKCKSLMIQQMSLRTMAKVRKSWNSE